MGFWDYHPITGPIRELNGTSEDQQKSCLSGEEGQFIDKDTGQEIEGAYWACGSCDYRPVRRDDGNCPQCGEIVDWDPNDPEHQEQ